MHRFEKVSMEFKNDRKGNGGTIVMSEAGGAEIGHLNYMVSPEENKLTISYVLVHPQYGGMGMGKKLVDEAVRWAREQGQKVYPYCGYARAVMKRNPEYQEDLIL